MSTDSTPALAHLRLDPVLARLIAAVPPLEPEIDLTEPPSADTIYLALLESIVSQQISVKAADAIFRRFRLLFSETAGAEGFPAPAQLLAKTADELRTAGLSYQKIGYLQSVALFAQTNRLDGLFLSALSDEEIIQYLLPIRGVGRWTVEMLLMFVLRRPDVFPVDDLVIRQKMVLAFDLTETGRPLYRRLQEIAEPWRPYRTLACRYLWRWKPGT